MMGDFGYKAGEAVIAMKMDGWYVWDCSVIRDGGKYHMFSSRWKKSLGFGWNWLFHSEVIHLTADCPEGPYQFENVVFRTRGPEYFDGRNTHNTNIHKYQDKYYLYYMGATYGGNPPVHMNEITPERALETWNRKRIGVAVATDLSGEFERRNTPLLQPRDCSHWDCTVTTNPTAAILPDGKTYLIYKSRAGFGSSLQLGVVAADRPDGNFERLTEGPIFEFMDPNVHIEDPFLWYDQKRKKFCLIAKDDSKNGAYGITGEWGSGFYAESDDCIHFTIAPDPLVYSRHVRWKDGKETVQGNLERPFVLFDEDGNPTHLFCASGNSSEPYRFEEETFIICMKLEKKL